MNKVWLIQNQSGQRPGQPPPVPAGKPKPTEQKKTPAPFSGVTSGMTSVSTSPDGRPWTGAAVASRDTAPVALPAAHEHDVSPPDAVRMTVNDGRDDDLLDDTATDGTTMIWI
jgi:hypothetical protein